MHKILDSVRVIDLTTVVLGAYATKFLGDLGAKVIKVESPTGDVFRFSGTGKSEGMSAGFMYLNMNKQSVAIDLRKQDGLNILNSLIESADIVVHNARPYSMERLGLTWERLAEKKPELVFCYAPGFAQAGPYANLPAYDDTIQALSGLTRLNSHSDGSPRFVNTVVCDKVGGMHLAMAALAGLVRARSTGEGSCIEAPMFESFVSFLLAEHLAGQSFDPPTDNMGYHRLLAPHRQVYRTKDGHIAALPYTTEHWVRFFESMGRNDLAHAEWVKDSSRRSERIDDLYKVLAEMLATEVTDHWSQLCTDLDIPFARVNAMDDLLDDAQLKATQFFYRYDHPTEGPMTMARNPFTVSGETPAADRPVSRHGADTVETLLESGFSRSDIREFAESGVLPTVDGSEVSSRIRSE